MGSVCPPFDYLATCSEPGLQSYELSRLNQAANLRKEVRQLLDRWIDCEVEARMARLTLESRRTDVRAVASPLPESHAGTLPQQLSLPLLPPDAAVPAAEHRGNSQPRESGDRQPLRANRATVVPRAPAKDRVPDGAGVDAEAFVAPALLPCAQHCEPRLHDERNARRNLQLFVRQQTEDPTQGQSAARGKARLRPSRSRDQRELCALRNPERRNSSVRVPKIAFFALTSDAVVRVTARTSSCFSRPDCHHQQPRQLSKAYAPGSNPLNRHYHLPHGVEPWRTFCNDSHDSYPTPCVVQ